ncbi:MAG: Cobalamin-binding protein [Candidatus Methanogasteraceae archaeon]|nr:MAG: Cobalamin-binding protein [ANME-2 cluster archaeon]
MKMSIVLGITMSLLLLALPAAASDYTLGVFGNANEDETINMQDVTYTELIILEYRDETELADGKHDDKINMQDVTQIELIILGKEKEITVLDSADRTVTVEKPVESVIVYMPAIAEAIQVLDATDKVVGVGSIVAGGGKWKETEKMFPVLNDLPACGSQTLMDYEAVLNLNPDVVINFGWCNPDEAQEHLPGIDVIALNFVKPTDIIEEFQKLGYLLDKRDEAEEFFGWYEGYLETVNDRIEALSDDEKPTVYYSGPMAWFYKTSGKGSHAGLYELSVIAGGANIAASLPHSGSWITVDSEWVVEQNPDIIVTPAWPDVEGGYATDDPSGMKERRDSVMTRPELAKVTAVQSESVFVCNYDILASPSCCVIAPVYHAKWFHPDLFGDMDPQAIHQEYVDRFKRIDFDVTEHGVFVYPPLESCWF